MSATIEKRTLCEGCLDERRRLLEYALNGALEVLGFELVKLVTQTVPAPATQPDTPAK